MTTRLPEWHPRPLRFNRGLTGPVRNVSHPIQFSKNMSPESGDLLGYQQLAENANFFYLNNRRIPFSIRKIQPLRTGQTNAEFVRRKRNIDLATPIVKGKMTSVPFRPVPDRIFFCKVPIFSLLQDPFDLQKPSFHGHGRR